MLLIPCPWCGSRSEDEFVCGSEADKKRPKDPSALSDAEWADYVFNHDNIKGNAREQWWHNKGCGRWFVIERNTVTHEITPVEGGGSK